MKHVSTPSPELDTELELKHRVEAHQHAQALAQASSAHRIDQYYFRPVLASFDATQSPCLISIADVQLSLAVTEKKRLTLLAILDQTPEPTIRLRRMDDDWYFTVKGLSLDEGTLEFEVGIAPEQGLSLVPHAYLDLEKTRHLVKEDGYLWEVDVYVGKLDGLVVAELENRAYAVFPPATLPAWVGLDVTQDFRYKNTRLAAMQAGDVQALLAETSPRP